MKYDTYLGKYLRKLARIEIRNEETNRIVASANLELTDYINVENQSIELPLD